MIRTMKKVSRFYYSEKFGFVFFLIIIVVVSEEHFLSMKNFELELELNFCHEIALPQNFYCSSEYFSFERIFSSFYVIFYLFVR